MAFAYFDDFLNFAFGVDITLPIPTFGLLVATALIIGNWVITQEVRRYISINRLPSHTYYNNESTDILSVISNIFPWCLVLGFVGARTFHIIEYPHRFMSDPMAMILTRDGFSVYGGLITGSIVGIMLLRRRRIPLLPILDACSPALILGYGIGRIGCQLSGDGDWGIAANMALKPDFLPTWLWAQTYDNNIAGVTIHTPGVYPTPVYEAAMAIMIFLFLWSIRKHSMPTGFMFSLYLVLSGLERFSIENIRVNIDYEFFYISLTQAQIISSIVIITGLLGVAFLLYKHYSKGGGSAKSV